MEGREIPPGCGNDRMGYFPWTRHLHSFSPTSESIKPHFSFIHAAYRCIVLSFLCGISFVWHEIAGLVCTNRWLLYTWNSISCRVLVIGDFSRFKYSTYLESTFPSFFINSAYTGIMLSFDISRYILHKKKIKNVWSYAKILANQRKYFILYKMYSFDYPLISNTRNGRIYKTEKSWH